MIDRDLIRSYRSLAVGLGIIRETKLVRLKVVLDEQLAEDQHGDRPAASDLANL